MGFVFDSLDAEAANRFRIALGVYGIGFADTCFRFGIKSRISPILPGQFFLQNRYYHRKLAANQADEKCPVNCRRQMVRFPFFGNF
jgi:hypothetical protein